MMGPEDNVLREPSAADEPLAPLTRPDAPAASAAPAALFSPVTAEAPRVAVAPNEAVAPGAAVMPNPPVAPAAGDAPNAALTPARPAAPAAAYVPTISGNVPVKGDPAEGNNNPFALEVHPDGGSPLAPAAVMQPRVAPAAASPVQAAVPGIPAVPGAPGANPAFPAGGTYDAMGGVSPHGGPGMTPAPYGQEQPEPQPPPSAPSLSNEQVTGHTANLWKYLPVPDNEPDQMPEYLNHTYSLPGSKVIAARVRGKKHKHEGTNCDDWYEVASFRDITFVAVSDGAGSKKFSRVGARESCKASVGYLVKTFEKQLTEKPEILTNLSLELTNPKCMEACGLLAGIVQQSVIQAFEAVQAAYYSRLTNSDYDRVLNRALQFKDLSGTLLIAVVIPVHSAAQEHLVISCQIGDGMIALLNTKGTLETSLKLMGVADSGEFAGETDFLTSDQMKSRDKLQSRTKISRGVSDRLFVMTDGVSDDYYPNETEMRRLYFDLIVNGILDSGARSIQSNALAPEHMKLFKRIPDPISYPWVNDQKVKISLQYTNRICEALKVSLADLWKDTTILELATFELDDLRRIADRSERLRVWLDNYVERGSFDDRTLVVVQM